MPGLGASKRMAVGVEVNKRNGSRSQFKETAARLSGSLKSHSLNLHISCLYTVHCMFMHTHTQTHTIAAEITQTHTVVHLGVQSAIRCSSFPPCCLTVTRLRFKGLVRRKKLEEEEEEKEEEAEGEGGSDRAFYLFLFFFRTANSSSACSLCLGREIGAAILRSCSLFKPSA